MTYEMIQWLSNEGKQETGKTLVFKKGTPTYELKPKYKNMVGGHPSVSQYQKDGGKLDKEYTIKETQKMRRFGIVSIDTDAKNSSGAPIYAHVRLQDAQSYSRIKYGVIIAIAIAIIGIIWYKRKHK